MSDTPISVGKLPFEGGWKRALLEYRHAIFWYAAIVFVNVCVVAAAFYNPLNIKNILSQNIVAPSWLVTIVVAFGGFLVSLRQKRKLKIPRVYLAFFVLASSIQLTSFVAWTNHYQLLFWIAELLHNILLCLMSLEVISFLLPVQYVKIWTTSAFCILALGIVPRLSSASTFILDLGISANFTAGCLLVLLVFIRVRWTREYMMVTAGVIAILLSDIVLPLTVRAGITGRPLLVAQLAPLVGIVIISAAGSNGERGD